MIFDLTFQQELFQAQLKKTTETATAELETLRFERETKSSETNLYNVIISSKKRRECSAREESLRLKLERLNEEHKRLKEVMVSTIQLPCPLPHLKCTSKSYLLQALALIWISSS